MKENVKIAGHTVSITVVDGVTGTSYCDYNKNNITVYRSKGEAESIIEHKVAAQIFNLLLQHTGLYCLIRKDTIKSLTTEDLVMCMQSAFHSFMEDNSFNFSLGVPRSIIIGKHTYDIEVLDIPYINDKYEEQEHSFVGRVFYNQNKIVITNHRPESQIKRTVAHEILHALFQASGVNYSFKKFKKPGDLVFFMADTFYQFLKDNTEVFDF